MSTEFDTDTALSPAGDGHFTGDVTDRWMIGGGPNGGYIAAFLMRGLVAITPQPDPLSMTTHYVGRPEVGPCDVEVAITHATRSHAFMRASLSQQGSVRAHAIAVFGKRRPEQLVDIALSSPAATPPGTGARVREVPLGETVPLMSFLERFEYRQESDVDLFAVSDRPAEVGGWTRLVDRDLDDVALPLFCDCWPPPMFVRHGPGVSPTIELTVHFRQTPEPGWNWCAFASRVLSGGYVEEEGQVWSESGTLIAQSRQLARFTLAPPTAP